MNIYTIIAARFFVCKESLARARAAAVSSLFRPSPPSLHIFQNRGRGGTEKERRSEKQLERKFSRFPAEKRGSLEAHSLVAL